MSSVNLEEQILDELAQKMCSDIDFEILAGMLVGIGWTRVVLKPMMKERSDAVDSWVAMYVKNPYENRGLLWVFEDQADAVNFTLKWL